MSNPITLTADGHTFALTDDTVRLVAADALTTDGRELEAALLRLKNDKGELIPVAISATGKICRADQVAVAIRHGRVARPGKALSFVSHEDRREAGEIIRRKDGMWMVTESTALRYVSDDYIEDMDAWSSYPEGPGRYSNYTAIPVEETGSEAAEREKKEAESEAKAMAAEVKKQAESYQWAPFASLPTAYDLPKSLLAGIKWVEIFNDRHLSKFGHGTTRRIGTLPDGTQIAHVASSQYDDWRDWYHIPASVASQIEAAKKKDEIRKDRAKQIETARAETVSESWTEAALKLADKDESVKIMETHYLDTGDAAALAAYQTALTASVGEIMAARQAEFDAAASEWQPKMAAEFGAEWASEAVADLKKNWEEYSHWTDIADEFSGEFENEQKRRAEEAAKAKEKAAKAASRKADPMVTVTGNTYPHRDALGNIPGSKLSKLKGGWTWKVPKSQVGKLPRGLRYED